MGVLHTFDGQGVFNQYMAAISGIHCYFKPCTRGSLCWPSALFPESKESLGDFLLFQSVN